MVKNLPAMQETQVRSLGWEDPLEKGMATHSSVLAWRIPWTEEAAGLVHGVAESRIRPSNFCASLSSLFMDASLFHRHRSPGRLVGLLVLHRSCQ